MEIIENFSQIGQYKLHYKQAGSSGPVVVLMHGIPTNSYLWHGVIPFLSEKYTVIAPDLLGYGQSDRGPQDQLSLPNQAQHILNLLDNLNINNAHFVGHDLGGGIAQILAVNFPERVLSMVVADGVCFANWPLPKVAAMRLPTAPEFEPGPNLIQQMMREGVLNPSILTYKVYQAFMEPFDSPTGPEELKLASLALDYHHTDNLIPSLSNLKVPTTLLWGQYDRFLPPYWGQQLQSVIPNASLKILPECSHYSMLDNPVLFAQELLNHLNSI